MRSLARIILIQIILLLGISWALGTHTAQAQGEQDQALKYYHQGIAAKSMGARETAFEKALALYIKRFNQMRKQGKANAMLCFNIANCYFNLQEVPEAIYYYQLAKSLDPLNSQIDANLKTALSKRQNGVDMTQGGITRTLLFFHYKLSAAQQIKALTASAIICALALLYLLFAKGIIIRYIAITSALAALSLCLSLGLLYYSPNNMGVVMREYAPRHGAGEGFAPLGKSPLGGGSTIRVLSLDNGWYQVELNDGRRGYLPKETLRVVAL